MSIHLHAAIVSRTGIFANNFGETEGNNAILKKVTRGGRSYITYSAESIRYALRKQLACYEETNRFLDESKDIPVNAWKDFDRNELPLRIDDDCLGFMDARNGVVKGKGKKGKNINVGEPAASAESNGQGDENSADETLENLTRIRRSVVSHSPAQSLLHFLGDRMFNAASPGATSSSKDNNSKEKNPGLYGCEMIYSPFQYFYSVTPERLNVPNRLRAVVESHIALPPVAGKQNTFHNDLSPDSIVFRITHEACPRIGLCFSPTPQTTATNDTQVAYHCNDLVRLVQNGDIPAAELVIGGRISQDPAIQALAKLGASVSAGVKEAGEIAIVRTLAQLVQNGKPPTPAGFPIRESAAAKKTAKSRQK